MRRALLPAALLLALAAAPALANREATERRIEAQDRLDATTDRTRILNDARDAVKADDSAMNRYLLGRAYGIVGELDKAKEQFDWAIERDPGYPYAYLGLGVYHMMKGDPEQAEAQFETALRLDPKLNRARLNLGQLYLSRGERVAAERAFQEVLKNEPDNHEVRTLLAFQYLKDKRYELAIQELQVVLSKVPDNVGARKVYAIALGLSKRTDEAIREFERVIEARPKDIESYAFLKNLYRDKGDQENEIHTLERLLDVLPEDHPLRKETAAEIERIREGRPPPGSAPTFEDILKQLDSEDVEVRREAMRTLCDLDYTTLPARMVRAVRDPDPVVRTLVVKKLAATNPVDGIPLLEIILLHPKDRDSEESVRAAAARGIAKSGDPAALPILIAALDDDSDYVFRIVVESLRDATGVVLDGEVTEPPNPAHREKTAKLWRSWWTGEHAFARKLRAIDSILAMDFARGRRYVALLLADDEPMVAEKAFDAYEKLTGEKPGDRSELKTPEGRAKLAAAALTRLEGK